VLEAPILEGRLVRLEPLSPDHGSGLVQAATGPRESFVYTSVPADDGMMRAYVETALAWHAAGTAVPFAILDCHTGRVVGSTRFFDVQYWAWDRDKPHQRGENLPAAVEIGHTWLAPWAQRTGINTEAKLLMLTHAFETWRVHRVRLTTDARNTRSRAAIERLGARLDGILRAHHAAYDGAIRDSAFYSILDTEWPSAKAALIGRLRLD
jgi:RimJ/RimL family protein N-acetyltransferase